MAENPLLPGTLMEVFEKYPDSRRLDFENFGDVCKTSFAKGVITDFYNDAAPDAPPQVKSRVKVTIDGQETDYLPIFYHPKKKFWDDPLIMATDYNEEGGYFEKAWMSFRKDDEVTVMLKEGKPVAVMGFADGVPRPGEDVLKSAFGGQHWWQVSLPAVYPDGDTGPDQNDLGLKLPCERILRDSITSPDPTPVMSVDTFSHRWGTLVDRETVRTTLPGLMMDYSLLTVHCQQHATSGSKSFYRSTTTRRYKYLVKIGPFLYWIEQSSGETNYHWGEETTGTEDGGIVGATWLRHNYYLEYLTSIGLNPTGAPFDFPEVEGYADAWIVAHTTDVTDTYTLPPIWPDTKRSGITDVAQALYSKELYDRARDAVKMPDEFTGGNPLWWFIGFNGYLPSPYYGLWPPIGSLNKEIEGIGDADCAFMVRPHTKAELQAAGMWPAGV